MEKWEKYFFQPKPIDDILGNAVVFIDTNVLLSAYQWREVTVKEVISALKILNNEGRLKIPLQVIKEFARNRPKEIVMRLNELEEAISRLQSPGALTQKVPMLEGVEKFEEVKELQHNYEEGLNSYRKGLMELRDDLKSLFYEDHILSQLQEIFKTAVFNPEGIKSEADLIKVAEKRFKDQIPPGYKDSPKEDNSAGDYIIWANILQLKQDVIFVSNEKKADWVYTDKHKKTVSVRRELTEEFFEESGGHTFGYLSPKELITFLKPNVSKEVKEDLESSVQIISKFENNTIKLIPLQDEIADILYKADPMHLVHSKYQRDEYSSEASSIVYELEALESKPTFGQLVDIVHSVFAKAFGRTIVGDSSDYVDIAKSITTVLSHTAKITYP
ncbi:PIN-like domain-containing protein [Priestia megaterium]|uniref:PIN-like domain-containing protein n=1 Tax=Priestia megaterium TaxID=1404 RepID=UPI003D96D7D1